jgi:hypothetical protein
MFFGYQSRRTKKHQSTKSLGLFQTFSFWMKEVGPIFGKIKKFEIRNYFWCFGAFLVQD